VSAHDARESAGTRTLGLVRGAVERVIVSAPPLDPYLGLKAASDYTGLSVKTLRRAVNDIPERALPCYRVGGALILIRRGELDSWLAQRRTVGRPSLVRALRELGLETSA
jgi:excisionase family DNA binding protein